MNSNKFGINLLLTVFIILVFSYIAFLTVVPRILENNFDNLTFKRNFFNITKLNLESKQPTFYTTKDLMVGIRFKEVKLNYPDNKKFMESAKIDFEVALLPLLTNTVKLTKIEAFSANLDIIVLPNGKYKMNDFLNNYFSLRLLNSIYPSLKNHTIKLAPVTLKNYYILETKVSTGNVKTRNGDTLTISEDQVRTFIKPYFNSSDNKNNIKIK